MTAREHNLAGPKNEPEVASRRPREETAAPMLELQRTAGNRGVSALMRRPEAIEPVTSGVALVQRLITERQARQARRKAQDAYPAVALRINHIKQRHGQNSTATGAGKFLNDSQIYALIKTAIDEGTVDSSGQGGFKFEHTFAEQVGISINRQAAYRVRVILTVPGRGQPFINTAFPF